MQFAKWVFLLAGVSGVILLIPAYFVEDLFGRDLPPPVNHPELYYGFFGVTLAWQVMFVIIGADPVRYRTAMLAAMAEKASFSFAIPVLYAYDRVAVIWLLPAAFDGTLLVLFAISYWLTPRE